VHQRRTIEWPTVGVAATIWGGFAAVLVWHDRLPAVATIVVLGVLAGWYGSLQHEVIHGHPTRWRTINRAIAVAPLGLAFPFEWYRQAHLTHHRDELLTHPDLDPETTYVSAERWAELGPIRRAVCWALRTVIGRVVLNPIVAALTTWRANRPWAKPDEAMVAVRHLFGVAAVVLVVRSSGLALWEYVVGAAWIGAGLTSLRSFAEHRAGEVGHRTAAVRSNLFFSLLYLNNNLHVAHHHRPGLAWYRLPALHDEIGGDAIAADGGGLYEGYGTLVRRHLWRPVTSPVHPQHAVTV
jgi:fatty acid desaturase